MRHPGQPVGGYEYAQEQSGAGGRHLLHSACLLRDLGRDVREFGQVNYDIALGDCLWHIYRMTGKLSGLVCLVSAAVDPLA